MPEPATSSPSSSPVQAVTRVRELIDALGDALVSWQIGRVESLHADLTDAVSALPGHALSAMDGTARQRLVVELGLVANGLARCRRLGASISELAGLQAHALGETEGYDASGVKTTSGALPITRARV